MKKIAEPQALIQLRRAKQGFSEYISQNYGAKAKDCRSCTTVCCADSDFVNVNITRLEAVAIWQTLNSSPRIGKERLEKVLARAREAIEKYQLTEQGDTFKQTYSCPLFDQGCLVHWKAKPAPCIQHGCYDNWQDLPDTHQFARVEKRVEQLNERVYGSTEPLRYATIPIWLIEIAQELQNISESTPVEPEDSSDPINT